MMPPPFLQAPGATAASLGTVPSPLAGQTTSSQAEGAAGSTQTAADSTKGNSSPDTTCRGCI